MNYLDSRNYSIPFKWLVLHILLGITVVYSHTVAQLWGIVALVVGIGLILKNRNRNEEVASYRLPGFARGTSKSM